MSGPAEFNDFNPNNPFTQLALLAQRVDALCKEKEALEVNERKLEDRISRMEKTFERGAGIMLVVPVIGAAIGIVLAYGEKIFAPWMGRP